MPRTMKTSAITFGMAILMSANMAIAKEPNVQSPNEPVDRGFVIDGGFSYLDQPRYTVENLFLGARWKRVLITTGLEVHHKPFSQSWPGRQDTSAYSPYWGIQGQVAMLRAQDRRLEINVLGGFAIGKDRDVFSARPQAETNLNIVARLGFGIQYWALPNIALNMTTGVAYRYSDVGAPVPNSEAVFSNSVGLFTQLRLVYVASSP